MERDEYRGVIRSLILKIVCSVVVAAVTGYLSVRDVIKLGVLTTVFLGFMLTFCAGGKVFMESNKIMSGRAVNYRRVKRGLEPLDLADQPSAEFRSGFQRRD